MKREDILPFSGKNVEVIIMPNAEKTVGVLRCHDDHVEIGGALLVYQMIWGIKSIAPVPAPAAKPAAPSANVYARAVECAQKGQIDEAAVLYAEAVKKNDHRKQAVNVLFGLYMKAGKYPEAKKLLDDYGSALDEDTLFHHRCLYCTTAKQGVPEFLQLLSKRIKALGKSDHAKRLSYLRQKAMLERSIGNNQQAVSSCNTGLTEAEALGSKLPKGFERYVVSMKRIKALSLHAMGSKKAVTLARELMTVPEMKGDASLLAILEQGNHAQEDEGDKPPDLPVWLEIVQVYSSIRTLIREKLPPALGVDPSELDDVLLKEKLIPNPNLYSSFIENSIKNHSVSPDLLDVVSLETLGGIMARWWESVFAGYFGGRPYYGWLNEKLSLLKTVRDTIAHAHAEYLSSDDIAHAENICREINKCLGLPV